MERNLNAAADLFLYCNIKPNKNDFESVKYYIEQRMKDYESCLTKCRYIKICGEPKYYPDTAIEITVSCIVDHLKSRLFKLTEEELNGISQETSSTRTQRTPPGL